MARNYDGKVTIGFDIDTKELENGIRESERRLKQFQREGEQLSKQKIKTEADVSEMEAGSKIIEQEFDKEIAKAREVKASQKDINEMMQNKAQIMSLVNAGTEEYKQVDLTSVFNMYSGEKHHIRLKCANGLLDTMIERFGTKTANYTKTDDKNFIVSAEVEVSNQFFGWLLGFGEEAVLQGPPSTIQQFTEYLDNVKKLY